MLNNIKYLYFVLPEMEHIIITTQYGKLIMKIIKELILIDPKHKLKIIKWHRTTPGTAEPVCMWVFHDD